MPTRLQAVESEIRIGPETKALIVDFDGTVLQTFDAHVRSLAAVAQQLIGIDVSPEVAAEAFKTTALPGHVPHSEENIFRAMLQNVAHLLQREETLWPTTQLVTLRDTFVREHASQFDIYPLEGISETLHAAAANQIPVALASNSNPHFIIPLLDRFSLTVYFSQLVTPNPEIGLRSKPYPDLYLNCLERLGLRAAECKILEDSHTGTIAGLRAGIEVIVCPRPEIISLVHQKVTGVRIDEQLSRDYTLIKSWTQIRFEPRNTDTVNA